MEKRLLASLGLSVRPSAWNNSALIYKEKRGNYGVYTTSITHLLLFFMYVYLNTTGMSCLEPRIPRDGFSRNFVFDFVWKILSRKFKFLYSLPRIAGTSLEGVFTVMTLSVSFLPKMRNVSDKNYREN